MSGSIVISSRVIETLNSLPQSERIAVSAALANYILLGEEINIGLSPVQAMVYAALQYYVERDTKKAQEIFDSAMA